MNCKKFTEGKTEMEYDGNIHLNDPNWDIVKKYRIVDDKGKLKYTFLAKCKKCGFEKEVSNSGIYKGYIFCPNCSEQSEIGKIYGHYKVLGFVKWEGDSQKRYKVQCTKCGAIYEKRISNVKQSSPDSKCINCDRIGGNTGYNRLYSQYKTGAKKRNIDFNLSTDEFYNLVTKNCVYCGQEPTERTTDLTTNHNTNIHYSIITNGIDRIDSNKGYEINNCVPCCEKCNKMKLNYSKEDFFNHISKIYNYSIANKKEGNGINVNTEAIKMI